MKNALRCVPLLLLLLLAFVPRFGAAGSASLTRGPYLQAAGQSTITLVWNIDVSAPCVLRWGTKPAPAWENVQSLEAARVHSVTLNALRPDTRYFYEVEGDGVVLATGADCYFDTYPPLQSRKPFTFLAWGDSGTGDANQGAVASQMNALSPRPAFGLGIGDLIYPAGEAANYNPRFFTPYAPLLRNLVIWPAMGNHDAATQNGKPYRDAFVLPTTSGTELYYSFDYGNAHFTCLDSQVTYFAGSAARNAMLAWLTADLDAANANGARWKFVFFHHPPYSKGTHDSDAEAQLAWMRNNLNPIMEARGVDFVLTGHSHVYERSYLLKNNAALQTSLNDYTKIATPDGTIYIVTGCGGKTGSGTLNHPLMAFAQGDIAGNTVIDVSFD
ncbi:partial Alkaline phosphatase, partial [Planctomycetaceae bacterium]